MWYLTWVLGVSFAVLLAVMNALWLENFDERNKAFADRDENKTIE